MIYLFRGVAQSGSVLALGARSRRFKSSHPDQFLKGNTMNKILEFIQLFILSILLYMATILAFVI